jgi:hypothetical protein
MKDIVKAMRRVLYKQLCIFESFAAIGDVQTYLLQVMLHLLEGIRSPLLIA